MIYAEIEAEYVKDEEDRKKKAPVIDVAEIEHDLPSSEHTTSPSLAPTAAPSGIPSSSTTTTPPPTSRPPLTQGMIIKMGNLAHSADVSVKGRSGNIGHD